MRNDADNIVGLYERHAGAWVRARLREGNLYERKWLESFCGLIPANGSVLDIGCGAGEPIATYFVGRGYSVMGVDSSTAMISMFQARLPGQETLSRICDCYPFGAPSAAFSPGTASST